jgi:polyisoprenoid-binding protein YceI
MAAFAGIRRHWKGWAIGLVAAVLLVTVVGPFVYIHFVEGKPPAPLSLASGSSTTSTARPAVATAGAAAPSGVDGTWNVSSGSTAGYRVKETLFGQSNTAVGRTTAVTGTIDIAGTAVTTGSFSVDLRKVSSDRSQRDEQFQGRIMNTSRFPTATFTLTSPIQFSTLPAEGAQTTQTVTGDLSMHGVTNSVTFPVTAQRASGTIAVSGSINITFADWNISNPSGGPATTADNGVLEFLINFSHA